jgi:hypothetical protein
MSTLEPDAFALAVWALHDAEKDAKRSRKPSRTATADGFPTGGTTTSEGAVVIADPDAYAASALQRTVDELSQVGADTPEQGAGRNHALNTAAFSLGRLVGAGILEPDLVEEALLGACETNGLEAWTGSYACYATIRSGLTAGQRDPLQWVQGERPAVEPAVPFLQEVSSGVVPVLPNSWLPIELAPFLDGSHKPVLPTLLRRTDGVAALYPGRVHWLSGEPESLKSWLALLACYQALLDGERVVYVDLEDSPGGMAERLLDMGLDRDVVASRFAYLSPTGALSSETRGQLAPVMQGASLLIIDAATEALSLQGLSPQDDVDIARWLELLPRWAAKHGPAVLVLDHVVKAADNRGRWATGSQHKLAGLDGIALLVEPVQPGGRGKTGRSRVFVAKDRHGHLGPHVVMSAGGKRWFADLVVDGSGRTPFLDIALFPPSAQEGEFKPTILMGRVAEKLTVARDPLTGTEIEDRVGGRAVLVRKAVAQLIDDGFVEVTRGPHNSKLHRLVKAYPDDEQVAA